MLEEKIAEDKDNEGKGTRHKLNYVSYKEIRREKEIHNYSQTIYIYGRNWTMADESNGNLALENLLEFDLRGL